jgi:hypothetical protein
MDISLKFIKRRAFHKDNWSANNITHSKNIMKATETELELDSRGIFALILRCSHLSKW